MKSLLTHFPPIEVGGKKNSEKIYCESFMVLIAILWLETDKKVKSYSQPKVNVPVRYKAVEYNFGIDLSVQFQTGDNWWISFVDAETQELFGKYPILVELVKSNCRASGGRYVAMCASRKNGFNLEIVVGA